MIRHAWFSADGRHRLLLSRRWSGGQLLAWVMLNPSTADENVDDATMRRVIDYTDRWGYGGCRVANLFTLVTSSPKLLIAAVRAGEPMHDDALRTTLHGNRNRDVVAAWGANVSNPTLAAAAPPIIEWAREQNVRLRCLGVTLGGQPLHPLRLDKTLRPRDWKPT